MDDTADAERGSNNTRQRQHGDEDERDAPKPKRQRVSRACDQCRASRDRCDGKAPCLTCETSNRQCSYTTAPKKRGIQPGYIRALELSLATLISSRSNNRRRLAEGLGVGGALRHSISSKDAVREGSTDDLLSTWNSSKICQQIDALLSGAPDVDMHEELVGSPDTPASEAEADSMPTTLMSTDPDILKENLNGRYQQPIETQVELPPDFWSILDHYDSFTHNWLPISDKNDILKTSYAYPITKRMMLASNESRASHAELWATIALTSRLRGSGEQSSSAARLARECLTMDQLGKPELGQIRSHVLLALLCLGLGDSLGAWLDIGTAVRLFTHQYWQMMPTFRVPDTLRLALGLFAIEGILSAQVKSPPHLSIQRMQQYDTARLQEDGLEEWSPWRAPQDVDGAQSGPASRRPGRCLSTFNQLVTIATKTDPKSVLPRGPVADVTSYSPHQLHVEVMYAWFTYIKSDMPFLQASRKVLSLLEHFKVCGGAEAVPPTILPLLRSFMLSKHITDPAGGYGYSFAAEVISRWDVGIVNSIDSGFTMTAFDDLSQADLQQLGISPMSTALQSQSRTSGFERRLTNDTRQSLPQDLPHVARSVPGPPIAGVDLPGHPTTSNRPHRQSEATMTLEPVQTIPNQDTPSATSDPGPTNADMQAIFDEFAQLDGTVEADNGAQFMQNLGLGPESDLRAFFGADYQETDPLLAYLSMDRPFEATDPAGFPT